MSIKKVTAIIMASVLATAHLGGCAMSGRSEPKEFLREGESIPLRVSIPEGTTLCTDRVDYGQRQVLGKLSSMESLRSGYDNIFGTEQTADGKHGLLYIKPDGRYSNDSILKDAVKNEHFIYRYWKNDEVIASLAQLAAESYPDVEADDPKAHYAAVSAYYELLDVKKDENGTELFIPNGTISREEFLVADYKASSPVSNDDALDFAGEDDEYCIATGNFNEGSAFAKENARYSWLKYTNGGLNEHNINKPISKIEAVYFITNKYFADRVFISYGASLNGVRNAGDMPENLGVKTVDKDGNEKYARGWELKVLSEMLASPAKGIDGTLHQATVVALRMGIIDRDKKFDWNAALTRQEAVEMIIRTQIAINELYGYKVNFSRGILTAEEYPGTAQE